MSTSFKHLCPGDRARVAGFQGLNNAYRNRLLSLGMTPGTEFTVKRVAPLGDPVEIVLRGFRLSLRCQEAEGLLVEKL
jgi:ferrous iron transport protein A